MKLTGQQISKELHPQIFASRNAMSDMFGQVEEWWDKSAELVTCCRMPPNGVSHGHPSGGEVSKDWFAKAPDASKTSDATTPWATRCSSTPDHAHSIALRQGQHKFEEKLSEVNKLYAHVFAVPSSHPCSFVPGRNSQTATDHVGALCS